MCLTAVLIWKPTETSFGLDKMILWIWNETSLKMVMNLGFSEPFFPQIKWWSYDLISVAMNLEWSYKVYVSLRLGLTLKMNCFWKWTCGFLGNNRNCEVMITWTHYFNGMCYVNVICWWICAWILILVNYLKNRCFSKMIQTLIKW